MEHYQNLHYVFLVFAFVIFCLGTWAGGQPEPNGYWWRRLMSLGFAFATAAFLFG